MCGLSGFVRSGKLNQDVGYARYTWQSLYANALRGEHSTGLFTVDHHYNAFFAKDTCEPRLFLGQKRVDTYIDSVSRNCMVAVNHNRYATVGGRGYESAHPHNAKNIIMVHNGTLKEYQWLPQPEGKANSDSARLAEQLAQDEPGGLATWKKVKGAYAVVWYDMRSKSLYVAKNEERELSYVVAHDSMFFASEAPMLEWMTTRNGFFHKAADVRDFAIHTLYQYSLENLDVANPVLTPYDPEPAPVVARHGATFYDKDGKPDNVINLTAPGTVPKFQPINGKRAKKVNSFLKSRGISAKVGDTIEVLVGQFLPYATNGDKGKVVGYFDDDCMLMTSKCKVQLYADVHQCCAWGTNKERDSVFATIRGVSPRSTDHELILICEWAAHGMYRESWTWREDPIMQKLFEGERWRYHDRDHARYKMGDHLLTSREMDRYASEDSCYVCATPSETIPTGDIHYDATGSHFICEKCTVDGNKTIVL